MMGNADQDDAAGSLAMAVASRDAALADLAVRYMDRIEKSVVGAEERVDLPGVETATEELRAFAPLTKEQEKVASRITKELARIIIKTVSSTVLDTENVKVYIHLDDNLAPLMEFIAAFTEQLEASKTQHTDTDLLRWSPFAISASVHFVCAQLPAYDAMRCTQLATRVLETCQRLHQKSSEAELLSVAFSRLVPLTSQDVSKHVWVSEHSISKHVLAWVVERVSFPHFGGDVLGRVLALVFPLVDDLNDATQLVGARILLHIVRNVTDTELRWYTDVLLEVLRGAITSRKPATLDFLVETLVVSLDKVSPPDDFQYYDRFVPRLLNDCSMFTEIALRKIYTRHLRVVISRLGAPNSIYIIRFLQPLVKVLIASFEAIDSSLLIETLETLRVTILSAWPRIPHHLEPIFVGVLKAVAVCEVFEDTSRLSEEDKLQMVELYEDVIVLLADLDAAQVKTLLQRVADESHVLKPFATRMLARLT